MDYQKELNEGLTQSQCLTEPIYATSNFFEIQEMEDDIDQQLNETDFVNHFDSKYPWLNLLEHLRLLGKINSPDDSDDIPSEEDDYSNDAYSEEVPYELKDKEDCSEPNSLEADSEKQEQTKIEENQKKIEAIEEQENFEEEPELPIPEAQDKKADNKKEELEEKISFDILLTHISERLRD